MIYFLVPGQHADIVQDYSDKLGQWGEENMAAISYQDAAGMKEFLPGRYVFTGLDRLGPHTSRLFGELHQRLRAGLGAPPLNHPEESLRRYELLKTMHEEGTNEFRAFGAWEDLSDLRYPVFVRPRSQDGGVPKLLSSRSAVEREVGRLLIAGSSIEEVLVVEFLDTADSAGFYTKYSAYYVEGHSFPTAMDKGKAWVMRAHSVEHSDEFIAEEKEYLMGNPHEAEVAEIFRLAKIEFGRLDYSMHHGRVQVWEINTLPLQRRPPGVAPRPQELQDRLNYKKELNARRLSDAWRAVEARNSEASPVLVSFGSEILKNANRELSSSAPPTYPQGDRFSLPRTILRPFKPVLKPLAERILYPLLSRRARGGQGKDSSRAG